MPHGHVSDHNGYAECERGNGHIKQQSIVLSKPTHDPIHDAAALTYSLALRSYFSWQGTIVVVSCSIS